MYADSVTLYQTAIERNPTCWLAYNNLGVDLAGRGQVDQAIAYYQKVLEIKPDHVEAHNNLGLEFAGRGQTDQAIAHYQKALEIKPDHIEAWQTHNNLGGIIFAGRGQYADAIEGITEKPSKSSPTTLWPTTTWRMLWQPAARSMRRSTITYKPWR